MISLSTRCLLWFVTKLDAVCISVFINWCTGYFTFQSISLYLTIVHKFGKGSEVYSRLSHDFIKYILFCFFVKLVLLHYA